SRICSISLLCRRRMLARSARLRWSWLRSASRSLRSASSSASRLPAAVPAEGSAVGCPAASAAGSIGVSSAFSSRGFSWGVDSGSWASFMAKSASTGGQAARARRAPRAQGWGGMDRPSGARAPDARAGASARPGVERVARRCDGPTPLPCLRRMPSSEDVANLVEQALALAVLLVAELDLLELLEQPDLFGSDLGRDFDLDLDDEVAASVAVDARQTVTLDAQAVARLRALRHLEHDRLLREVRQFDRVAEHGLLEADRLARVQVVAVAHEHRVGEDVDDDDQIARRAAMLTGLALPGDALDVALLDAGRDADRQGLLLRDRAAPAVTAARVFDALAAPAARRAHGAHREEALAAHHRAVPAAGRAALRLRAGLGAAAVARLAAFLPRDLQRLLHAGRDLFEGELQVDAQARALASTTAAEELVEEPAAGVAEQVAE